MEETINVKSFLLQSLLTHRSAADAVGISTIGHYLCGTRVAVLLLVSVSYHLILSNLSILLVWLRRRDQFYASPCVVLPQ